MNASLLRKSARPGAILLIVLIFLVLFSLVAITFVVVANRYKATSIEAARLDQTGDRPQRLCDLSILQLLIGSRTSASAMFGHDLMADLYGNDSMAGVITGYQVEQCSDVLRIQYSAQGGNTPSAPGYFGGCVFTILDGAHKAISTRVLDYYPNDGNPQTGYFRVQQFEPEANIGVLPQTPWLSNGSRFIVNGRPFNGAGAGFSKSGGAYAPAVYNYNGQDLPVALLPNYRAYLDPSQMGLAAACGVDESYDAADFQNMFLFFKGSNGELIPSFHRPELIAYWRNRIPAAATDPKLLRMMCLRPLPTDHPYFTGSNRAMTGPNWPQALVDGPFDVDNDGDGVAESVWIDIGLPVKRGPDGRMYKPLVAFMVQDLDGRIDINASGTLAHSNQPAIDVTKYQGVNWLPRGSGYGPAEINWSPLAGGQYDSYLRQKYGGDNSPGRPSNVAGSALTWLKPLGQPPVFPIPSPLGGATGIPFDVWGQGFMAIDTTGRPLTWLNGNAYPAAEPTTNNPYQINLNSGRASPGGLDAPFTLTDLERLLRAYDQDAFALKSQLTQLMAARERITVRGTYIPTSYDILPPGLPSNLRTNSGSIIGLLGTRLSANGVSGPALQANLRAMLPWELFHGQRMDLNRAFGNGRDDNNNGVIDEPLESNTQLSPAETINVSGASPTAAGHQGAALDICNDDPIIRDNSLGFSANFTGANAYKENMFARQMFARHLYCLMRILSDEAYLHPTTEGLDQNTQWELTHRRIAQWAINVVDFRDPDAIMTGFEYDANPFNGWNVDGDIATDEQHADRRVVFGLEFPDLLLSEAIAFHDKNLRDTKYEGANGKELIDDPNAANPVQGDDDLDQYRKPEGTLVIELGCPRLPTSQNPQLPLELYAFNAMNNQFYLDMARMAPAGNNIPSYPVWRISISTPHDGNQNKGGNTYASTNTDSATFEPPLMKVPGPAAMPLERFIWFTGQNPNGYPEAGQANSEIYYSRGRNNPPMLAAGGIAVVGSRTNTYLGMNNTQPDALSSQLITIDPTTDQVTVTDRGGTQTQKPAVCIVAGANPSGWANTGNTAPQGIGVNISEPLPANNYYQEPSAQIAGFPVMDAYDDVTAPQGTFPDKPLDYVNGRPIMDNNWTKTGTYTDVRTASLQRLADPTQAFHPVSNPYITVDWLPLDLTVFNGADRRDNPGKKNPWPAAVKWDDLDPWTDAATPFSSPPAESFGTRQRGDNQYTFWSQMTQPAAVTPVQGATNGENFRYDLQHTLGGINAPMIAPAGYPQTPFPWIHHANRPLTSTMEILQVPASSQARLLHEFSMARQPNSGFSANINAATSPYDVGAAKEFHAPFAHLLNFYQTSPANGGTAANFYRIFDYVEVPSRYINSEKWFNSANFATNTGAEFFRPPYNKISRFQDPGRLNLNTISGPEVWGTPNQDGGVSGGRGPAWNDIELSRRGFAASGTNPNYPTRFCNPFRAAGAADLVPIPEMRVAGVDAGLMRRRLTWSGSGPPTPVGGPVVSLFADYDPVATLPATANQAAYRQPDVMQRHSYFSTETLTYLSDKVKTHSNVFACWLTVGYFEVESVTPSEANPDGWQLGQELNFETGEMKRHRAFYILDRSTPVGYFLPGEANNAERAILLRRYIP